MPWIFTTVIYHGYLPCIWSQLSWFLTSQPDLIFLEVIFIFLITGAWLQSSHNGASRRLHHVKGCPFGTARSLSREPNHCFLHSQSLVFCAEQSLFSYIHAVFPASARQSAVKTERSQLLARNHSRLLWNTPWLNIFTRNRHDSKNTSHRSPCLSYK